MVIGYEVIRVSIYGTFVLWGMWSFEFLSIQLLGYLSFCVYKLVAIGYDVIRVSIYGTFVLWGMGYLVIGYVVIGYVVI